MNDTNKTDHAIMDAHGKTGKRVSTYTFTREQVTACDFAAFTAAYSLENMSPDALREAYDSLVIKFSGFEQDPRALYEIAEARTFIRTLHQEWPYALFFLNVPAADLNTYVLCQLTTLLVEPRSSRCSHEVTFSRNELFQVLGRDFDPLETACQQAEFSAEVFRNRARQILKVFGFLKK